MFLHLLCAFAALGGSPLHAGATDYAQSLEQAIKRAESELEAEKTRIDREQQARRSELDEIRDTCKTLADQVVESRLSIARKQSELGRIRSQREDSWSARTQWRDDLSQAMLICAEIHKDLTELLTVVPPSEDRPNQGKQLADLETALAEDRPETAIQSVFAVLDSMLSEIRSTAVYSAEIIDPGGVRRQGQLLRVGQSLFAYDIPETSQTAIAISDPYEEGGFRWHESLSGPMREAVAETVGRAQSSPGIYALPVDVTGTMTTATSLSNKTLADRIKSGGVVMFPLGAVAVCLALLVCERLFVLCLERRHSLRVYERILDACSQGRFEQAEELAGRTRGVLSRILRVCLAHRESRPEILDDAIQEAFLHEFPKLERFLPSIRVLSSVAPILGLLGTVTGIIATFDMITVVGGGKPRLMAGGISEALITTATGLIIAIPGLLAHSFLSARVNGIIAYTESFAATLSNAIKRHQYSNADKQRKKADR